MEKQTQLDVHREVEYIKQDPEFNFDTHDEIEDILEYYKFNMPESPHLRAIIEKELAAIAEEHQTAEILRSLESQEDEEPILR